MKAEDYLTRVKTEYEHVQSMLDRLYDMKAKATFSGSRYSDNPGSGGSFDDRLGEVVAAYVDYSKKCYAAVQKFIEFRASIVNMIERLPDPMQVKILLKYYVEFKEMKQVAKEIGKSESHTYLLKRKALKAFGQILT